MLENHNFERTLSEEDTRKYRLPFALCKDYHIQTQDWWTPRDAWEALIKHGIVEDVSDAYDAYYQRLERERIKIGTEYHKSRENRRKEQLSDAVHRSDRSYVHKAGSIAGAEKQAPMTFRQADGGSVNPFFRSKFMGYRGNCQACVAAYYARRLGYDVQALPDFNNPAITALSRDISLAYRDQYGEHPQKKYITGRFRESIHKTVKEGEIYALEWRWKGKDDGHVVTVERVKGSIYFYDPQSGKIYPWKTSEKLFCGEATDFALLKLSGCTMDEKFSDKIMRKAEKRNEESKK